MTPVTARLEAISHKDVKGKTLLYLKIIANGNDILLNIGQKTFDSIQELAHIRETIPPNEKEKTK